MKEAPRHRRKPLAYALGLLVVGVWSLVLYRTYEALRPSGPDAHPALAAVARPAEAAADAPPPRGYRDDYADPFRPPAWVTQARPAPSAEAPAVPQPAAPASAERAPEGPGSPELSLIGIVDGTAFLAGTDEVVHFLQAGDTLAGARVVRVGRDDVTVRFGGETLTWALGP